METETQKRFGTKNQMGLILIFFSSVGIGYSLVNQFVYDKPKPELLGVMVCLLVAGIASKFRTGKDK